MSVQTDPQINLFHAWSQKQKSGSLWILIEPSKNPGKVSSFFVTFSCIKHFVVSIICFQVLILLIAISHRSRYHMEIEAHTFTRTQKIHIYHMSTYLCGIWYYMGVIFLYIISIFICSSLASNWIWFVPSLPPLPANHETWNWDGLLYTHTFVPFASTSTSGSHTPWNWALYL